MIVELDKSAGMAQLCYGLRVASQIADGPRGGWELVVAGSGGQRRRILEQVWDAAGGSTVLWV